MRGNKLFRALDSYGGRAAIALCSLLPDRRRGAISGGAVRRILVIKLSALGDTVLLIPSLQALRRQFPGAEIGMVGTAINREMVGELPHLVDRFFCLDVSRAVRDPRYLVGFVAGLREGGWEIGIDFDQWTNITPLLLRFSGVPVRVGFRTRARLRHRLYTHAVPREPGSHEARNFLRLLEPVGVREVEPLPELAVNRSDQERCRSELLDQGWNGSDPILLVHPGCGHAHPRAWPVARYQELFARLEGEGRHYLLVTGAGSERELARGLASASPDRSLAVTDRPLRDLLAFISLSDLVVSGNTGLMHLAAALKVPQLVLEGPNDPAKWGPLNPRARVIRSSCPGCPCLDFGWEFHRTDGYCMEQISVDEVFAAVVELLRQPRGIPPAPEGVRSTASAEAMERPDDGHARVGPERVAAHPTEPGDTSDAESVTR